MKRAPPFGFEIVVDYKRIFRSWHIGAVKTVLISGERADSVAHGSYLLLMFCYDDVFLGENHPVTLLVGVGCFIGSFFIFAKQLRLSAWGANIRMAIATVIVFWTPIEILGRMDLLSEIWVDPMGHKTEMIIILAAFLVLAVYLWYMGAKKKNAVSQ